MPTWNWELLVLFWGCRGWLFGHYLEFGLWPRFLPSLVSPSDPPQGVPEARVHLAVCPSSPGPGHSLLRHLPELHGGRDACLQEGGAWGCQLRPSCALAVKRCLPVCVCVCVLRGGGQSSACLGSREAGLRLGCLHCSASWLATFNLTVAHGIACPMLAATAYETLGSCWPCSRPCPASLDTGL